MAWVAAVAHAATHRSGGPLAYAGLAALWAREERTLAAWLPKRRCSVACALVAAQHRPLNLRPSRYGKVHGGGGQRPAEQRSATARLLL